MTDFSHLHKLNVGSDRTADLELFQIQGSPSLTLAPATEANSGYFNALLKKNKGYARRLKAGGVTPELMEKNRNQDRALYASHVVKGWTGVTDSHGDEVTFSKESCLQFLKALPDWIFDDVRTFAADPGSFLGEDDPSPEDIEAAEEN